MSGSGGSAKHVPERTCISCGGKKAKWELVRIVRTLNDGIVIDLRGKKAGRGAYLCRQRECWEECLKKRRLDHALKYQISSEQRKAILSYVNEMLGNTEKSQKCS
jgi:predicted RNA-binding protein YlxR (DUF448 family)